MTTHRGVPRSMVGSTAILIGLVLLIWPAGVSEASTVVNLAWDASSEPDIAGYRIHYGTSSGAYSLPTIGVGLVNAYSIMNLQSSTTYYFVVTAYDLAGNESLPSNEVAVRPTVVVLPAPTIVNAMEIDTPSPGSVYVLQSGSQTLQVNGTNFQGGAVLGLGPDISAGPASLLSASVLTASIVVSPSATLGPRTLTVTNPDGGAGSKANALTVVKTADINRDCRIDLLDLNILARAWNTLSTDSAYLAEADLDGDGDVGGLDLEILVTYIGTRLAVCP